MEAVLGEIPKQGFEIVSEQIGAVLAVEFAKQLQIYNQDKEPNDQLSVPIFNERVTPMDVEEDAYINILLDSATYSQFTQKDSQGRTIFFIDIYTQGKAGVMKGTSNATMLLQKYIGWVRYILSASAYKTLKFAPGLIGGTYIESFATLDPSAKEDSLYTRFARINFAVRIQENQELWHGVNLEAMNANVKLDLTERGYKYVFENIIT